MFFSRVWFFLIFLIFVATWASGYNGATTRHHTPRHRGGGNVSRARRCLQLSQSAPCQQAWSLTETDQERRKQYSFTGQSPLSRLSQSIRLACSVPVCFAFRVCAWDDPVCFVSPSKSFGYLGQVILDHVHDLCSVPVVHLPQFQTSEGYSDEVTSCPAQEMISY